jgi:benzoyl-CoA reductase/2-hydroxyglutaryl-CoA dehydratase subunit BcrC/BadD/HgdB
MEDLDFRKQNARELFEHELTQDQVEKLIEDKFKRARAYLKAYELQPEEVVDCD